MSLFNKNKVSKKLPVIFNCDTGIDDAVALLLAVKENRLDIRLVATNMGNANTLQSAENTNNVLELFEAPAIKVVAGDGKCFKKERPRVSVHGNGGLGEYEFKKNTRVVDKTDAVEAMYSELINSNEKIVIICLSPTSNLAKLFAKHPDCINKIDRIVLMAGTIDPNEMGDEPYPEFNIASDPEAAEVVFASGVNIDVVPMEMGHTAYLDWQDVVTTKNLNCTGSVLEVLYRSYKDRHVKNGIATHDGCAVAYVTHPEIFETKPAHGEIKYYDSIGSGVLIIDFNKNANIKVCTKVDIKKFKKLYFAALKRCK